MICIYVAYFSVMATRLPDSETPHPFDTIAQQIEEMTSNVISLALNRKHCLLVELSDHRFHYDNLVANKLQTEKELLYLKQHTENLTANELKEMQDEILSAIENKLSKLTFSVNSFKLDFQINTLSIQRVIDNLGKIVSIEFKIPEYSEMETPIVAVGKKGKQRHELDGPRGVAFEDGSELIFVCDNCNSCVKVFDSTCQFVNDFGSNELYRPWGILLHKSHIYVTDLDKCTLFKYQRSNYRFLLSVGRRGDGNGDFDSPGQLAIGPDECLYVPEIVNNRISVLDTELNFKRHFKHENIVIPVDVKFTEEMMFVLNAKSTKSINSFNLDGDFIESYSFENEVSTFFFTIDCIGNILFSHFFDHSVDVIRKDKMLYSIGHVGNDKGEFCFPYGLCITRNGNLIVASNNCNYGLQIF